MLVAITINGIPMIAFTWVVTNSAPFDLDNENTCIRVADNEIAFPNTMLAGARLLIN